jgi:hypothetical protein
MTLLDAQQYDVARERRRRIWIVCIIVGVLVLAWAAYHLRNYPERHAADKFFAGLQKQDYDTAYAIWFNDPHFKEHPQKYSEYPYNDFYRDWGPGGEWGLVKNHSVDCSFATNSGVIVQVTVNRRAEHAYLYVSKADKTLSFSPTEIQCGSLSWLTE